MFSNFFWKMAKRTLGENPQDLYNTIVKKKNDLRMHYLSGELIPLSIARKVLKVVSFLLANRK